MFKKTLFALGLSVIAATAMAATEGTDYVKLDKPYVNGGRQAHQDLQLRLPVLL